GERIACGRARSAQAHGPPPASSSSPPPALAGASGPLAGPTFTISDSLSVSLPSTSTVAGGISNAPSRADFTHQCIVVRSVVTPGAREDDCSRRLRAIESGASGFQSTSSVASLGGA